MRLPSLVSRACQPFSKSANIATASYVGLTAGNPDVIELFGSPAQKRKYVGALLDGGFFGTIALMEPQSGSHLAYLTTRAVPNLDSTYSIRGTKIFISGGDNELSEKFVHLVLARIPGGALSVKGILLFRVPKYRVNDGGTLGVRNGCAGRADSQDKPARRHIRHAVVRRKKRMHRRTLRRAPSRFHPHVPDDERDANRRRNGRADVWLPRLLAALQYARDRCQGRLSEEKCPDVAQVPLIERTDVQRMLIAQKSYVEGG